MKSVARFCQGNLGAKWLVILRDHYDKAKNARPAEKLHKYIIFSEGKGSSTHLLTE